MGVKRHCTLVIWKSRAVNMAETWDFGYSLTIHSSQGLSIGSPRKVWPLDGHLTWLVYLVPSSMKYMKQHKSVHIFPPNPTSLLYFDEGLETTFFSDASFGFFFQSSEFVRCSRRPSLLGAFLPGLLTSQFLPSLPRIVN